MKLIKKSLLLLLVLVVISVVGCSSKDNESASTNTDETENEETIVLRMTNTVTEEHASNIAWQETMEKVEKESDGRLKIELYPNGQLFSSDREAVEAVQMNNVEMTEIASSTLATFNAKYAVFDLPFLFLTREAAYDAQDGELGDLLNNELEDMNMIGLGYGENGFRHFLNDKHPIETPDDLKGLKMRVLESKIYEDIFNTLGANSSPLAFGEVYTALQQGVFDAMDSPISLIYSMKFNEVQKYLTLSGHTYAPTITLINKEVFEGLPEDLQDLLRESIAEFSQKQRELTVQQDEEEIKRLEDTMEINELTAEQKELFIEALAPVYDKYKDEIGADLIELAQKSNK